MIGFNTRPGRLPVYHDEMLLHWLGKLILDLVSATRQPLFGQDKPSVRQDARLAVHWIEQADARRPRDAVRHSATITCPTLSRVATLG